MEYELNTAGDCETWDPLDVEEYRTMIPGKKDPIEWGPDEVEFYKMLLMLEHSADNLPCIEFEPHSNLQKAMIKDLLAKCIRKLSGMLVEWSDLK